MITIKFRGRRTDTKQWQYGYHLVLHASAEDLHFIVDDNGVYHRADPETIGMYAGQKDKYGVEIYDGDILRERLDPDNPEDETRTVATWGGDKWMFREIHTNGSVFCEELGDVTGSEVIGNIYDDPALGICPDHAYPDPYGGNAPEGDAV